MVWVVETRGRSGGNVSDSTQTAGQGAGSRTLIYLAEWHLHLGLIGIDEFAERCKVAEWLDASDGGIDPREPFSEEKREPEKNPEKKNDASDGTSTQSNNSPENGIIHFVWSGWYFTRQDPDPYPSTPHGHLNKQPWPKLNPYTGRAFKQKHQEETRLRLNKREMIDLWGDLRFRDFCRSHILWYSETYPQHVFPVLHPFRFPRPWR